MNLTLKRLDLIGRKMNVKTGITSSTVCSDCPNPGTKVSIHVPYVFEASDFEG
jgi:hypothetical protein